jgi:hypothetical protein
MDVHVKEYYCQFSKDSPNGHFHKVIALHNEKDLTWKEISSMAPLLTKGWFEISHLRSEDRIEFICDFWTTKMPYHKDFNRYIEQFFSSLDDIGVFLTQKMFDSDFEAHLVYSLKNDNGFFRGELGASVQDIDRLQKSFPDYILPEDYLAFLLIHNGFSKSTDTGIIPSQKMPEVYQKFQDYLNTQDSLLTPKGIVINPKSLIPFYESFGLPCYHCFWGEWYPAQEMGNVYYSGLTHSISNCTSADSSPENLTFPTFMDWLMFYLEKID